MSNFQDIKTRYESQFEQLRARWVAQPDKPEETIESTFRALYLAAAGKPVSARKAVSTDLPELSPDQAGVLAALIDQRCSGTPLAHLTGRQDFMGIELLAGAGALIPRVETEILGNEALRLARMTADRQGRVIVLDVCTGCGNIPLALASHEPRCKAYGSDLSGEAVELAKKNALQLGLESKVDIRSGDLFEAFNTEEFFGKVDLVTCNPPYFPSVRVGTMDPEISQHEPRMAFDGGSLGITVVMRLIREAQKFLRPNSFLCFEIGLGQGNAVGRMLRNAKGYRDVRELVDSAGHARALVANT